MSFNFHSMPKFRCDSVKCPDVCYNIKKIDPEIIMRSPSIFFSCLICLALVTPTFGQATDWLPTIPVGDVEVRLELHSSGFNSFVQGVNQILPTKVVPIPDGSGRMVVSTLGGLIRIMDADGNILPSNDGIYINTNTCLLYTSPSPRDATLSRMPSSA